MRQGNKREKNDYGDEAPGGKDFLVVISIFLLLMLLCWIAWYKFGWLH